MTWTKVSSRRLCTSMACLILLLGLGSLNFGNAQLRHWGVKVALTSADVNYQNKLAPGFETTRRMGFSIGAYVEWFETGWFTLITQAEYAQKGLGTDFLITGPAGPEILERKTLYSRLDYLSVPILGKATLQLGSLSPYVLVGPRVDFFLGYESDLNSFSTLFEKYGRTAFGATVGIGIQADSILPLPVVIEARYNLDIKKSFDNGVVKASNNSVDLWLGVVI